MKPNVILVKDKSEAYKTAKELIYKFCNPKTVLFLSGGSTPALLYEDLAQEKRLKIGVAALIDERFGDKLHETSNEKMIAETGLTGYLKSKKIEFYRILENKNINNTSKDYEKIVSKLFSQYKNKIAILGIGADGHTAGIPAVEKLSKKIISDKISLVSFYDGKGKYGKRITLTFNGLSKFDTLIVLVLGEEKKKAINNMFKKGSIEHIPARFYLKKEIAKKTIIITDQKT